ncbi:hypothetical protein [Chitinophaga sedimenti]|uniref:hypothetical protein n=1 Tax=Chitinophaga sedimenti TaxID=2033606 RepID=UPI0035575F1B
MHHYAEDITFFSPFIRRVNNDPSGCIKDKGSLRAYFERALKGYPDLHFELFRYWKALIRWCYTTRALTTTSLQN